MQYIKKTLGHDIEMNTTLGFALSFDILLCLL